MGSIAWWEYRLARELIIDQSQPGRYFVLTLKIASTFSTSIGNSNGRFVAILRSSPVLTHTILKNNARAPAVDLSMHEDDSEEVDVGEHSLLEELDVP
jgi:hypothetical protein